MKKTNLLLAVAALTAASCSDNTDITSPIDPSGKEMISFSLSDGTQTRAGFTGSATNIAMRIQSNEKQGSGVKYTRTVAEAAKDAATTPSVETYSTVTFTDANTRYWDDAHGRKSLLSVFAVAVPNGGASIENNSKKLEQLLAKGDVSKDWGTNSDNTIEWTVTTNEQKKDAPGATSPTENIDKEDLVYANNIQSGGKDGVYRNYGSGYTPSMTGEATHRDGQMLFFQNSSMTDGNAATTANTDAPGHFDKGHLRFKHALSRISVKLVAGTGFTKASTGSFVLSSEGVQFLSMNVKGKLDIPTGVWTPDATAPTGTIVTKPIRKTTDDGASPTPAITSMYYETVAQMLPDYVINDGSSTNMITFKFDDNEYFITQDMIFDALNAKTENQVADYGYDTENKNKFIMMQGKNYSFEITINKKQIEAITATLKDWDKVSAEFAQDNAHITIITSRTGSEHNDELNLFKMEQDLGQIYTDDSYFSIAKGFSVFQGDYKTSGVADLKEMLNASSQSYSPKKWYADGWYYKDNQTAYHLRMLNNLAANEDGSSSEKDHNVTNTSDKSSFAMKNGAQSTQDYHWGAPMIQTTDVDFLKYSLTEGYSSSIHPGFVAPKNYVEKPINITELHMMSNINVILKTTTTSDKILLRTGSSESDYKYATVKITKLASSATVDMGSGLVTPSTAITTEETMTRPTTYFKQKETTDTGDDVSITQAFTWAVVPQTLVRTSSGTGTDHLVGITITTPDNNEYYVVADLSKIVPSSVGSQVGQMHTAGGENYITRWYPNHSYTYTFTLTKKGIEAITCTLADWVTVTASQIGITLEN